MQIKLNVASIYKVGGVKLVPGLNEVEDNNELKKFLANPLVKVDIDTKVIELVEDNNELKKFLANPLVKVDIDTKVIELVEDKPAEKTTKAK